MQLVGAMEKINEVLAKIIELPSQTFAHSLAEIVRSESNSSILRIPVSKLKALEFRFFLQRRMPLVITELNNNLQLSWSPTQLTADHGETTCSMEDCERKAATVRGQLKDFLKLFILNPNAHDRDSSTPIWKVRVSSAITIYKFPPNT
jgi:hypothetical protein